MKKHSNKAKQDDDDDSDRKLSTVPHIDNEKEKQRAIMRKKRSWRTGEGCQ
jgi:hypothetical protein